jgi:hypothetical protein
VLRGGAPSREAMVQGARRRYPPSAPARPLTLTLTLALTLTLTLTLTPTLTLTLTL